MSRSQITMPAIEQQDHSEPYPCQPYLAVRKDLKTACTIIVGRDRTVLFFDPKDGTIAHGAMDYLKSHFTVVRPYRAGEVLTYVQG